MNLFDLRQIKNTALFFLIFFVLSGPAFLFKSNPPTQKISVTFPRQQRKIASKNQIQASVAQKQCDLASRWRYRCDNNRKNCVKDRKETYLQCKSL